MNSFNLTRIEEVFNMVKNMKSKKSKSKSKDTTKSNKMEKPEIETNFSNKELLAYCGINCKECKLISNRRMILAKLFKESLEELPLDVFKKMVPIFKDVDTVLAFLKDFSEFMTYQTCCTASGFPCGKPDCEIRICVKEKGMRTCVDCGEYKNCTKLNFLKPHHKTLLQDLDEIKDKGIDKYVEEKIKPFKLEPIAI